MKVLFFLLLVVNLVLVFYVQSGTNFDSDTRLRPELQPEKIKLLSTSTACLEWRRHSCSGLQLAKANISKRN
jgi:hypothetical protein